MKLNSKRLYEKEKNDMQEQRKSRLGAYRERIFEIMDSLEEITDELDELQEEMADDEHEGVRASDIPEIPFHTGTFTGRNVYIRSRRKGALFRRHPVQSIYRKDGFSRKLICCT